MPPTILITKNISPNNFEIADNPSNARERKIMSPNTSPPIKKSDILKPSAAAFAIDPNTPGPGVAASTIIPNKNVIKKLMFMISREIVQR